MLLSSSGTWVRFIFTEKKLFFKKNMNIFNRIPGKVHIHRERKIFFRKKKKKKKKKYTFIRIPGKVHFHG